MKTYKNDQIKSQIFPYWIISNSTPGLTSLEVHFSWPVSVSVVLRIKEKSGSTGDPTQSFSSSLHQAVFYFSDSSFWLKKSSCMSSNNHTRSWLWTLDLFYKPSASWALFDSWNGREKTLSMDLERHPKYSLIRINWSVLSSNWLKPVKVMDEHLQFRFFVITRIMHTGLHVVSF